jgi:hypothetical protein
MPARKCVAAAMSAFAIAVVGAGPASAGEIKGPGSEFGVLAGSPEEAFTAAREQANSICSFSGLNHFHPGEFGELPIRTQSYGQLVVAGFKAVLPSPGEACNGHTSGLR